MRPESVASGILGEEIQLGSDIFIYFKMLSYNQKVFDRIAKTPNYTLADELKTDSGFLMIGDKEKIRAQMHAWIDELIKAASGEKNEK